MELTKEELESYQKINFSKGKNSIFYLDPSGNFLLKEFRRPSVVKIKNIEILLKYPKIQNSAYPLESLLVDGEVVGYVCSFYENARMFGEKSSFLFEQKYKAIQDTCDQLKQLHENGIVYNDMNRYNQLIDAAGGHLIDFESIWTSGDVAQIPSKLYFLFSQAKIIPSSQKVDQFKQYIVDLGFLYQANFEALFSIERRNVQDFVNVFWFDSKLYDFMNRQLTSLLDPSVKLIDYFDVLLPRFEDEKKVISERKVLKRNRNIKHLLMF